jgi:hypothetical protein
MSLEREFGNNFSFDDNLIDNQITLRKIIDYIDNKINKNGQ